MTAQRGKDLLIRIGDGGDPETFTTVAGLRATSLDFNAQAIDVTNSDSADMWREFIQMTIIVPTTIVTATDGAQARLVLNGCPFAETPPPRK